MYRNTRLVLACIFIVLLSPHVQVHADCWTVDYNGWSGQECNNGSYPTNDGWPTGSTEGGVNNDGGGWINGAGQYEAGSTVNGVNSVVGVKVKDPKEYGTGFGTDARTGTNCATGEPCTAKQQLNALSALRGQYTDWSQASSKELTDLMTAFKRELGMLADNSNAKNDLLKLQEGIQNGSITVSAKKQAQGSTFIFTPTAWLVPPSVRLPNGQTVGESASNAPPTYKDCRYCENGNQKTEQTVYCIPSESSCADYKLPEVTPIVQYRFPICQIYGPVEKNRSGAGFLSSRAHPVPSSLSFVLNDEEGDKPCEKPRFVDNLDGDGNPDNDLQVVTCPVKRPNLISGQNISITMNVTVTASEGYKAPLWAVRNATTPTACDIGPDVSAIYTAKPFDPYPIQVIGLPFSFPWIKVADGTYARSGAGTDSLANTLTNYLPGFVEPFNPSDKDSATSIPHFLTSSGAGTSLGTVNVGSVATISTNNWKADPYTPPPLNSPLILFKQIIQKKTYKEYADDNPPGSDLRLSDEITIINAPSYTLSSLTSDDPVKPYTLIVRNGTALGNLIIDTASLNHAGDTALLLIANKVTLAKKDPTTIGAIIIADTLDIGTFEPDIGHEISIKGNLSLTNPLPNPITRKRQDSDDRKPTIFIEFSPDAYLSLLPTLGSSYREWSQVE